MQRITQRMSQGVTQGITTDCLDLTDFLEISDLLLRSDTFRFRVTSWSMYPTLRKGDQLTVEPASPTSLQVGDVILFHQWDQLICHRVVALEKVGIGARIVTKGDAATGAGEVLDLGQVLGRVVAVRRSGLGCAGLSMLTDRCRTRLSPLVAQALLRLQGLRPYRQIMRALVSRCFDYSIGVPEGRRWYRYDRLCRDRSAPGLSGHQGFRLLAKLGGSTVASLHVVPRGEDYWLEALFVRLRYRGLGVASQLLTFACEIAVRSEARTLLAVLEQENQAARGLLAKTGFRPLPTSGAPDASVHIRDLAGNAMPAEVKQLFVS